MALAKALGGAQLQQQQRHEVFWARVFAFGAACVAGLLVARKRKLRRLHLHILTAKANDFGRYFGLDVGGTLAKLVYFQPAGGGIARHLGRAQHEEGCLHHIEAFLLALPPADRTAQRDERLELHVPSLGGTLHFCSFQSAKMGAVTDFVRRRFFHRYIKKISCTGGGAYKASAALSYACYSRLFEEKLGIEIHKADELEALIKGLNFVLQHANDECYTFKNVVLDTKGLGQADKTISPTLAEDELYPFLLVNIGSGVSILKVSGENEYERVSGTSLGGGTFWGLCKALSKLREFDEAMDASVAGDSNAVDMTVGDIYGTAGYSHFNLKPETVASSFGKMGARPEPRLGTRDEDLARALLFMITQNLGQVAYLNARRVSTKRIYFCGNFLRRNEIASRQLAYAIDFWSRSQMEAQFFLHEGFFGALGSFLGQFYESNLQKNIPAASPTSETTSGDGGGGGGGGSADAEAAASGGGEFDTQACDAQ
ncbi:hypothetical protein PybrP1_004699 [[Pythium] brassicae (nom. inval.)]|nr:hypothetical protein PybrP1_004699 [[Pythium] brassicae (nom. inval.)]